jgi:hypothetical protein
VATEVLLGLDPVRRLTVPHDRIDRLETHTGKAMLEHQPAIDLEYSVGLVWGFASLQTVDHFVTSPRSNEY